MSYTPVELRHVRVGRSLFGYNRAMVEQMIEEVAESFEATWRERGELADRCEELEKQIVELRRRDALLSQTLVAAEQAASDVREHARREAATILGEAQQEARAVVRRAHEQREALLIESRRIEAMLRAALALAEDGSAVGAAPLPDPLALPVREASQPAPRASEQPESSAVEQPGTRPAERAPYEPASFAQLAVEQLDLPAPPLPKPAPPSPAPVAAPPEPQLEPEPALAVEPLPAVVEPLTAAVQPLPLPSETLEDDEPAYEPAFDGWLREDTGELEAVSLPLDETRDDAPSQGPAPILRRLSGGSARDFDWGE